MGDCLECGYTNVKIHRSGMCRPCYNIRKAAYDSWHNLPQKVKDAINLLNFLKVIEKEQGVEFAQGFISKIPDNRFDCLLETDQLKSMYEKQIKKYFTDKKKGGD